MENLLRALLQIPEVSALAEAVESGGCPAAVTGLSPVHRAQIAAALSHRTGRPLVMVCADETEALRLAEDLAALTGQTPRSLFARELFVPAGAVSSRQWELKRVSTLYWLDRREDWSGLGLYALRLLFTTENPQEVDRVLRAWETAAPFAPGGCTRGLYLRGVE